MKIQSFQWIVGIYCAVIGTLILIVPHQFNAPVYALVQPQLMWWGSLFLLTGIGLICVATLAPPHRILIVVHLLAVAPVLLVAIGFARVATWTGTLNFLLLGLGLLLAPLLTRDRPRRSGTAPVLSPDLFAVIMGVCATGMGLIILLLPAQFMSPIYDIVRPKLFWYGLALLVSGLVLIGTQLTHLRSRFFVWAAPSLVTAAFLPFLTLSMTNHIWTGVAFYGGFGLTLVLLPWLGPRVRRVDPAALQTRLALVLMAVVTLPLIVIVAIGTASYDRQATHEALARQQNLATVLAQDVAIYVRLHRAPVAGIAAYPDLMALSAARQRTILEVWGHAYPDMVAVASYDVTGRGIARSDGRPPNSVKGFTFYDQARQTNQPSLQILISPVIHRPIFAFGSPVLDAGGHFIGFVTGVLEATRLAEVLAHAGAETHGSAYLVDQAGRAIAHPDNRLVSSFASLTALPPVAAFTRDPRGGTVRYGAPATEVLAAYAPVEGFGWGVIVERPVSDALVGVRSVREQAFGVLLLLIVLCSLLSTWISRRLAAPLNMLTHAVADFATGMGTTPLPHTALSEVAHLASRFDVMRQQILARTREREQVEEELRAAKDVAETANRAKSEFLGTVSHELRTPLTSIRGSLGLVTGGVTGPISPQTKALLDIADKNSERLVRLINDILDIEKIEAGKMTFDAKILELIPLVEQAIEANRGYADKFGVSYALTHAEPQFQVKGDADRLMQVLNNVLANGAKFSPVNGTVEVSVVCRGATVRVAVTDRGSGVPDEFRSRIFQKFAQADSSDTRQKGGTGLGLSIARAIVEKHGGQIDFTTEGGATTFFFDLPIWHEVTTPTSMDAMTIRDGVTVGRRR